MPPVAPKRPKLLSRDSFREGVFARDTHKCVLCKKTAVDAHHIIERRLWPDGGYYLENGSSLCADCHWKAEKCEVTCEAIRAACGIKITVLPPELDPSKKWDKWGKEIV